MFGGILVDPTTALARLKTDQLALLSAVTKNLHVVEVGKLLCETIYKWQ